MTRDFNRLILSQASKLRYTVKDTAPSTERDLFAPSGLVIWSGASERTIWGDAIVNHAFRAIHDTLHLQTGMGFSIDEEIELGRIQANQYTGLLADIVYLEVAGQAKYFKTHGVFVPDQVVFTVSNLTLR